MSVSYTHLDVYKRQANGYKRSIVDNLVKKHRKKKNNIELQENNRNKVRYIAVSYTHLGHL